MLARLLAMLGLGRSAAPPAPAQEPQAPVVQQEAARIVGPLSDRDRDRLKGVHPDLVRVVERARADFEFFVIEGVRTPERQRELFAKGASRTLQSRHLTGHAVDLGPVPLVWSDHPAFARMAEAVRKAAEAEGVPVRWGGHFRGFYDGPHFELPRDRYP